MRIHEKLHRSLKFYPKGERREGERKKILGMVVLFALAHGNLIH